MLWLVRPTDSEVRNGLERALTTHPEIGRQIRRRLSTYRTSFPLEELDLALEDGAELHLIFKDLAWSALDEDARLAKPKFLHDPRREPAVYASVLSPRALGPRYYGSDIDPQAERYWLFVERVDGRELYQVGEIELWRATATWLAEMHGALAAAAEREAERAHLIDYDEAYYRRWLARAREFAAADRERARTLDWLAGRYDAAIEALLALPRTVIHGELYASNVLLGGDRKAPRVCPVDWEMAALGPGLVDLAALVSGGWGEEEREAIVDAYRSVAEVPAFSDEQLALCRLHLAIQWLGWASPQWTPPQGQRHDWLAEAVVLAEGLGL
jgi:Ser/Thr protein kinase RdoA (MazF antagonist)